MTHMYEDANARARESLAAMGLTEEQVAQALDTLNNPPTAHKYPGDPVEVSHADVYDPARVAQLEAETGIGGPAIDPSRPCPQTAGDLFMSLNGFDEIAVVARFGATIAELRTDPVTLGRALAFVHMRRNAQGQPGADESAYQGAMALTIQQVSHEYFQPEPKADADPSGEAPGVA